MIGQLVLDSKIRAKQVIEAAYAERDKIIADANAQAENIIREKKLALDIQIEEETRKYEAIQEEVDELIELVNKVQRKFLSSFKAIHELEGTIPAKAAASDEEYDDADLDSTEFKDDLELGKAQASFWDWDEEEKKDDDISDTAKLRSAAGDLYALIEEEFPSEGSLGKFETTSFDEADTHEYDDAFLRLTAEAMALDDPDEE